MTATYVRTQEIVHDIGAAGVFSLRVASAPVELRAVDGGTATVRATFDVRTGTESQADEIMERALLRSRKESGLLEISEARPSGPGLAALGRLLGVGGPTAGLRIEAEVPRGADIRYDGVNADLFAAGFEGSQQYHTVSGDLVLSEAGGRLQLRCVSGNVTVRAGVPIALGGSTVSGDLSVAAPRFSQLRINTISGDVELEGELAAEHAHRVDTVSGDLSIGLVGAGTIEVRGMSTDADVSLPHRLEGTRDRRRYVVGDSEATLLFSSMSGDVSVGPARRTASTDRESPSVADDDELAVLRALESGEIDVDEASRRLAARTR